MDTVSSPHPLLLILHDGVLEQFDAVDGGGLVRHIDVSGVIVIDEE